MVGQCQQVSVKADFRTSSVDRYTIWRTTTSFCTSNGDESSPRILLCRSESKRRGD
uniref:Uncharacterized protein n=1 Tax=Arundo donax TaxID=35708 RepID=A0A0A9CYK8_ARUDO